MHDTLTLVGDEVAVWPVSTLKLRENEESLVADLESSDSWDLLEIWRVLIFVWHQIVIKIKWQVRLGDLILHDNGVWDSIDDGGSDSLKEVIVLGLIMASMPSVLMTVLSAFYYEYNFSCVHSVKLFFLKKDIVINSSVEYKSNAFVTFGQKHDKF